MTEREWIDGFAAALGVASPGDDQVAVILELAGEAAHASQRTAAPVACWMGAAAGIAPAEALELARRVPGGGGGTQCPRPGGGGWPRPWPPPATRVRRRWDGRPRDASPPSWSGRTGR